MERLAQGKVTFPKLVQIQKRLLNIRGCSFWDVMPLIVSVQRLYRDIHIETMIGFTSAIKKIQER